MKEAVREKALIVIWFIVCCLLGMVIVIDVNSDISYRSGIGYDEIVWQWVGTAYTGSATSYTTTNRYTGQIVAAIFEPSVEAGKIPTNNWDFYLYDDFDHDLLNGHGVDKSNTDEDMITSATASLGYAVNTKLKFLSEWVGTAKEGTCTIIIKKEYLP